MSAERIEEGHACEVDDSSRGRPDRTRASVGFEELPRSLVDHEFDSDRLNAIPAPFSADGDNVDVGAVIFRY